MVKIMLAVRVMLFVMIFAVGYTQLDTLHGLVTQVGNGSLIPFWNCNRVVYVEVAGEMCQLNARLLAQLRYLQGLSSADITVATSSIKAVIIGITSVSDMVRVKT